jgi:hypothetical protein
VLYTLKTILGEAEGEGFIEGNPLEHSEPMGKRCRKSDVFSAEELRRLFPSDEKNWLESGRRQGSALEKRSARTGSKNEEEARFCVSCGKLQWHYHFPQRPMAQSARVLPAFGGGN